VGHARRAIFAGFWGGMLAGVTDSLFALLAGGSLLGSTHWMHVLAIGGGLGALAGFSLAVVFFGWSLGLEQLLGRSRWLSGAHAVALLLALPLIVYDAFALFHGARASQISAHGLLSVLLVFLGAAFVWSGATLWDCLRAHADAGERRGTLLVLGLVLVGLGLCGGWANQSILPRLYPWFHLTLALAQLVLCVLGVRLLLAVGRRILPRRWSWTLAFVAALALLVGTLVERSALSRSQVLRYFIHEKTQLARIFVHILPQPSPRVAPSGVARQAPDALPPLGPGPHRPNADIVLITVDAVRADHVGSYGYARPTTPNIDALAARGVRFERAYTQAPHTSFALVSLMIGKYYSTLARLASSETHETLAWILRRYGWKTAAFFPPAVFFVDAQKMKAFESNNFDFEYVKYEYLDAEARVRQIEDFLDQENPKKLFLWLHLFEPHEPYEEHPGFAFGSRDIDRYDSEIAYSDSVVGKVLDLLGERRPGAIVIVAADHGEEFGEHGGRYHGTTLFDEQARVPLIVAGPGLGAHAVAGAVQIIDIPATVLGLLDLPRPARMRGTDLGPWLATPPAAADRLPPAFAEVEGKRMVVLGSEKLICDIGRDYCSLYDLESDPGEKRDLADARPERVAALRQRLDIWLSLQSRFEAKLEGAAGGEGEIARAVERARLGDAGVAQTLAEMLLKAAPVASRREAAHLLVTALPARPESKSALLAAANQAEDGTIRDWAAVAALRAGADEVRERVQALLAEAAGPVTKGVRVEAAMALAEQSDAAGIEALVQALDACEGDMTVCRRIIAALAKLKDGRAVAPLVARIDVVLTRHEIVKALAAIGDAAAVPTLITRLESDPYVSVRAAAAEGLGCIGGARAVQALRTALHREKEEIVLASVRTALARRGR